MDSTTLHHHQGAKTRILFVDDEPNLLHGLQRTLRPLRFEWEMEFADSGHAALALMAERRFDAIVSDMRMPKISGAELLLNTERLYPLTLRFILSGQMERAQVLQAVGVAHRALAKPCDATALKQSIAESRDAVKALSTSAMELITVDPWRRLPCLSTDSEHLLQLLAQEAPSLSTIGDIAARNPALSAIILRFAHSPLLCKSSSDWHPARATARLDLEIIRDLLKSYNKLDPTSDDTLVGAVCINSAICAERARSRAEQKGFSEQQANNIYAAALLRNIGELILISKRPLEYEAVIQDARVRGVPQILVERETFGADHAQIGGSMLGLWGFPPIIKDVAAFHHSPSTYDGEYQEVLDLICAVDSELA